MHLTFCNYWANYLVSCFCSHMYLGLSDGTSPALEVKGMAYDCYAKCGKVPSYPSAPTSPISCSTPINVHWHPWPYNCQRCICPFVTSLPLCTAITGLTKGATIERWGGMGGCDWLKHNYSTKTKLKIHVKQLRSITCPKIHLQAYLEMPYKAMVLVWNPIVRSFSFASVSSILDECKSQIIPRPPFLNAWECGKLKIVGRTIHGKPTLLTTTKGG
jgi:hypothetical protein